MGVMECSRVGCTNVMCDRYSPNYGYICNECLEQLRTSPVTIPTFMKMHKEEYKELFMKDRTEEIDKEFK